MFIRLSLETKHKLGEITTEGTNLSWSPKNAFDVLINKRQFLFPS